MEFNFSENIGDLNQSPPAVIDHIDVTHDFSLSDQRPLSDWLAGSFMGTVSKVHTDKSLVSIPDSSLEAYPLKEGATHAFGQSSAGELNQTQGTAFISHDATVFQRTTIATKGEPVRIKRYRVCPAPVDVD